MSWIDHQFAEFGSKVACHEGGRTWTYAQFGAEVDRLAVLMSPVVGAEPAVVAIQMVGTLEAIAAVFAIARLKQIALPLSPEMPMAELVELRRIAGASFVLSEAGLGAQPSELKPSKLVEQLAERGHASR